MTVKNRQIGAVKRESITTNPYLNLLISIYLQAVEDMQAPPSRIYRTGGESRLVESAAEWLESDTAKAMHDFIADELARGDLKHG